MALKRSFQKLQSFSPNFLNQNIYMGGLSLQSYKSHNLTKMENFKTSILES
jgi:hypothetical protein